MCICRHQQAFSNAWPVSSSFPSLFAFGLFPSRRNNMGQSEDQARWKFSLFRGNFPHPSLAYSPLFCRRDVCLLPRYTRCASRRLSSDAEKRPGFSRLKKNTSLLCSTLLDLLGLISVAFCVFPGLFSRTRRRGGIEPTSNYCTKATLFLDRGFV